MKHTEIRINVVMTYFDLHAELLRISHDPRNYNRMSFLYQNLVDLFVGE